jgi:hypothetical protein
VIVAITSLTYTPDPHPYLISLQKARDRSITRPTEYVRLRRTHGREFLYALRFLNPQLLPNVEYGDSKDSVNIWHVIHTMYQSENAHPREISTLFCNGVSSARCRINSVNDFSAPFFSGYTVTVIIVPVGTTGILFEYLGSAAVRPIYVQGVYSPPWESNPEYIDNLAQYGGGVNFPPLRSTANAHDSPNTRTEMRRPMHSAILSLPTPRNLMLQPR